VANDDPYIIHYAGGIKPWKEPFSELADVWWKYARRTPFYEMLIADLCRPKETIGTYQRTKTTHYLGGLFKKIKSVRSKKYYLFGVQVWHKKR
jgi:lipopolysaccharide biosynthesis glycosyltransferase